MSSITATNAIPTTAPTTAPTPAATAGTERRPVWRVGLASSAAAAIVTTVLAAIAAAAGVSFAVAPGETIPLLGFTELTFGFSMVGVALAAVLARRARNPRSTFVRTTVALTVLSCVPDVTFGFDAVSAVTLIALHLVAAAIVIPAVASRLAVRR